jgi:hypothetical protein
MDDMAADSEIREISSIESLSQFPASLPKDIPALPGMETWVNIRDLGAKGDGEQMIQRFSVTLFQNIKPYMCRRVFTG